MDGIVVNAITGDPLPGARLKLAFQQQPFRATYLWPGEYHVYAVADAGQAQLLEDSNYQRAHAGDFPVIQLAERESPQVTVKVPAK